MTDPRMTEAGRAPFGIDVTVPNVARMYDYFLGGKDHYAADRAAAEQVMRTAPFAPLLARQNRAFLARAVRHLAGAGITQFIDLGTGLPTRGSVHEVAREIVPGARVAYVDNDPVVVAHGRALLGKAADTIVVEGDIRRPAEIMFGSRIRDLIDFGRPVGLLMLSVLHCLDDADKPHEAVATLADELSPGSHVVISHITGDDEVTRNSTSVYAKASSNMNHRSREEILRFFTGFDLLDPGLVRLTEWRPAPGDAPGDVAGKARDGAGGSGYFFCGVGRKAG